MQFINENQTPMDVERQYMRYLKLQRNYSPNTLEAYRHDLDYLLSYCRKNDKDPLDMKLEDLQHFAATIHEYEMPMAFLFSQIDSQFNDMKLRQKNKDSIIIPLRIID